MSLPVSDPQGGATMRRLSAVAPLVQLLTGVVIIAAGLHAARAILAPLALAVFAAAVSLPVMTWLRRRGAHTTVAIFLVVAINASLLTFVGWVIVQTVNELRVELPTYLERAQILEGGLREWLEARGITMPPDTFATLVQPDQLLNTVTSAARNITSVLALFLLILLYMVFVLAESVALPDKVRRVLGPESRVLAGGAAVVAQVQRYLALKTLISLVTGSLIGVAAAIFGVDFALFWGLLAFLLNYIPTIGSITAAVVGIAVALLQLGPGPAFGMSIVYVVVNVTVGSIMDPILIGRQLRLSPIVVLVSLVFWGWTWGPIGAFLSVPLTITLRMVLERIQGLQPFAELMGPVEDTRPLDLPSGVAR